MTAKETWQKTFSALKNQIQFYIPFGIPMALSLVALFILSQTGHDQVSKVLGPFVRSFFGDSFLHYPDQTQFLGAFFPLAKKTIDLLIGPVAAILLARKVGEWKGAKPTKSSLTSLWILAFALFFFIWSGGRLLTIWFQKFLFSLQADLGATLSIGLTTLIFILFTLLIGVVFEWIFMFAIPHLVLKDPFLIPSIRKGFSLALKNKKTTFLLAFVPIFIFWVFSWGLAILSQRTWIHWPEIIPTVLILETIFSAFINTFFMVSVTLYFLTPSGEKHV